MKNYKTDNDCEKLFNRFAELSNIGNTLFGRLSAASEIVKNPDQIIKETDLKNFFQLISSLQVTLGLMSEELDDLYGDIGVYIDEREIK